MKNINNNFYSRFVLLLLLIGVGFLYLYYHGLWSEKYPIQSTEIFHYNGSAYFVQLNKFNHVLFEIQGNTNKHPFRSKTILLENEKKLGPNNAKRNTVQTNGQGRFTHWRTRLVFATSDNSDPRLNGRDYHIHVTYNFKSFQIAILYLSCWIFLLLHYFYSKQRIKHVTGVFVARFICIVNSLLLKAVLHYERIEKVLNTKIFFAHIGGLALALFLFYVVPVVFFDKSFFYARWNDGTLHKWAAYPLSVTIHEMLSSGNFPFWSSYNALGYPLSVEFKTSLYSPFHWPAFIYPTPSMWEFVFLLRLLVIGAGMYLFLRSCAIRSWVAFAFSLLFMFSGHLFLRGNGWHINSLALTPIFFYGIQQLFKKKWRSAFQIISLSWCFMLAGGGFIDVILCGLLGSLAIIAKMFSKEKTTTNEDTRLMTCKIFFISCIVGTGLIGVYLIPLTESRLIAVPAWPGRSHVTFNSWEHFLSMFFHKLSVLSTDYSYGMQFKQHISIITLLGVALAFIRFNRMCAVHKLWLVSMCIFSGIYFGKLYGLSCLQFINDVPILKQIRFDKYYGVPYFAIYCIAAIGIENALKKQYRKDSHIENFTVLILASLPVWYLLHVDDHPIGYDFKIASIYSAAYAITLILFYILLKYKRLGKSHTCILLYMLILTSILVDFEYDFLRNEPAVPDDRIEALSWLKEQTRGSHVRVFDTTLVPKKNALYSVPDIQEYSDSLHPRYKEIIKEYALKGNVINDYVVMASNDYKQLNYDLLSFLNVGYLVIKPSESPIKQHVKTEFSSIYENTNVFPRAYLAHKIILEKNSDIILEKIVAQPNIALHQAYIEEKLSNQITVHNRNVVITDNVQISYFSANEIRINVETNDAGMLVLLDQFYPGWKAYINNKETKIYNTNYLYRGVFVNEGKSSIRFSYNPASFYFGLVITLVFATIMTLIVKLWKT